MEETESTTGQSIQAIQVWQTLTTAQQQQVGQTIVAICQQWVAKQQERSNDDTNPSED